MLRVLSLVLFIGVVLGACGRPGITTSSDGVAALSRRWVESPSTDRKIHHVLILNSLGEDYTILSDLHEEMQVLKNVPMASGGSSDRHSCQSPSHVFQDASYLYITCSRSHELHIIDRADFHLVRIIPLGEGKNPMHTVIAKEGKAFASLFSSNQVVVFNPKVDLGAGESRIGSCIDLGSFAYEHDTGVVTLPRPGGMALRNETLYVALANLDRNLVAGGPGYFAELDTQSHRVTKVIKSRGRNTVALYVGNLPATQDLLYVLNSGTYRLAGGGFIGDGSVDVYDMQRGDIAHSIALGGAPSRLSMARNGVAYVTNSKEGVILSFDSASREVLPSINIAPHRCDQGDTLSLSYLSTVLVDDEFIYATEFNSNCFLMIDRATRQVVKTVKTGHGPDVMIAL